MASAVVLLPGIVALLYLGGWAWAALLSAAAGLGASEYYRLTLKRLGVEAAAGIVVAAALPLLPVLHPAQAIPDALWLVVATSVFAWCYHVFRADLAEAPARAGHLLAGVLFSASGLLALSLLRGRPHGLEWVACALLVTWINDAAAYFGGRLLGRHKLAPRISPGKTWEGFATGWLASVGGMLAARATFFPALPLLGCVGVGAICGVTGPLGDLAKSVLKRAYGVKDSGKLIPGHGGMLDRVDALLFNALVLLAFASALG